MKKRFTMQYIIKVQSGDCAKIFEVNYITQKYRTMCRFDKMKYKPTGKWHTFSKDSYFRPSPKNIKIEYTILTYDEYILELL